MNPKLTQKLYDKYPKIFPNRCGFNHGDGWYGIMDAMCEAVTDSYTALLDVDESLAEAWGIEPLVNSVKGTTRYVVEVKSPQVIAHQVKEKLGTLRFYYTLEFEDRFQELLRSDHPPAEAISIARNAEQFMDGIVWFAETLSARTCEETGREGRLHTTGGDPFGWMRTLNDEFAKTDDFCVSRNYLPPADLPAEDGRD